jgi:hypothetical protein
MEKITGYAPEVCRAANVLRRSYSFARVMEGLKNMSGFRIYEFKGTTFETDYLVSGVYMIARTQYRDMEEMGQRYLAWEILEDIDSHYRG